MPGKQVMRSNKQPRYEDLTRGLRNNGADPAAALLADAFQSDLVLPEDEAPWAIYLTSGEVWRRMK